MRRVKNPILEDSFPAKIEGEEALRPIESLISKSEKARQKVAPGSWQHTMLGENLKALYLVSSLMREELADPAGLPRADFEGALRALASMIGRTEKMQPKFAFGTSQHTLQRNRLKALRVGEGLVRAVIEQL